MKFEEALAAMREGKKVIAVGDPSEIGEQAPMSWGCADSRALDVHECMQMDWQIYEEPKWEPKGGSFMVLGGIEANIIDYGLKRPTQEQAKAARDKMRTFNRLLAYVDEHSGGYKFVCNNDNYSVYYDHSNGKWYDESHCTVQDVGRVYMTQECAEQLCKDLNSGKVIL